MISSKLTSHERKDIEKFTKFLALKATQVIVQSRLGERICTTCNPNSSVSDWFNLAIHDLPDVQAEAKKALAAQMLNVGLSMCTEISLKTVEGDMLVLETWSLGMKEECDPNIRFTYSVYNRMSLLLKSLIAATRVTPAYKLSCRQGPESYVICYRIYMGEPQFYLLGEGYQQARIGEVGTPMGTVTLSVMYRTKLTITPQKNLGKDCPITSMMKSDYFKPDMSPKKLHGFSTNICSEPRSPVIEIPDIKSFFKSPVGDSNVANPATSPSPLNDDLIGPETFAENNGFIDLPDHKRIGAFASSPKTLDESEFLLPETSFLTVLKEDLQRSMATMAATSMTMEKNGETSSQEGSEEGLTAQKSGSSETSACDDFVLVELKPPFADCEGTGDLGAFFRDFQLAPPLVSFAQQPTLEEQVKDIRCQLEALETSMPDLDSFVDSLCSPEASK